MTGKGGLIHQHDMLNMHIVMLIIACSEKGKKGIIRKECLIAKCYLLKCWARQASCRTGGAAGHLTASQRVIFWA